MSLVVSSGNTISTSSSTQRGFDIDNKIFTPQFCFEQFFESINKAKLYMTTSTTSPEWFRNDLKEIKKLYDNESMEIDDFKEYFVNFYNTYKEDFDREEEMYLEIKEYKLPIRTILNEIKEKAFKTRLKRNSKALINVLETKFYLFFLMFNFLDEGGEELWEQLDEISHELDDFFGCKGPSNFVETKPAFNMSGIASLLGMASSMGLNIDGSQETIDSFQRIINNAVSSFGENPTELTNENGGMDIGKMCSKVSETFSNKDIQKDLENVFSNSKKIIENNSNNPAVMNAIQGIAKMANKN